MPSPDELHWVKSTANELNNLLQVITESSQFLQRFTGGNPEAARYYDMMRSAVDRAAQLSRTMLERSGRGPGSPAEAPPLSRPGQFRLRARPGPGRAASRPREAPRIDVRIANRRGPARAYHDRR